MRGFLNLLQMNTTEKLTREKFALFFRSLNVPVDSSKLSMGDFQQAGLLRELVLQFKGNPMKAYKNAVDTHFDHNDVVVQSVVTPSKPLLTSPEFADNREQRELFLHRQRQLQEGYHDSEKQFPFEKNMTSAEQNEYGELIIRNRNAVRMYGRGKRGRRKQKYFQRAERKNQHLLKKERHFIRKRNEAVDDAVRKDMGDCIREFVQDGSTTLCILPNARSVYIPSLIAGYAGNSAPLFINTHEDYAVQMLFDSFIDLLIDIDRLKGVGKTSYDEQARGKHDRKTGKFYIPQPFKSLASRYMLAQFSEEKNYCDKYKFSDTEAAARFFFHWNLVPLQGGLVDSLRSVAPSSLDAIVFDRRMYAVPEHEREATLCELDMLLKKDGHLLFHEAPREQAAIEYYGDDIFTRGYTRVRQNNLYFPNHWMVYQKDRDWYE